MADDIQSNIRINVDTASAMDSIRLLQNQISAFHTQMAKMGAASVADSRNMQQNLINSINSTGAFTANMTKVKTTAEQFTSSLEKNKLTMGEYFRYAGGATKSFGRLFQSEFETINKVARERVKDLQTQYIKLGRDANGAMQAIKVRPLTLDMQNLGTKTQIAAQRQQLLNQLLKQGSTNLLNFGKNTQWAGRQLMVGFTIPLSIMGAAAMRAYKDIEEAAIRLRRVYGDLGTTNMETDKMVKEIQLLAQEYTKYGVAVKDSMDMAATAAATGKKGADLLAQVASSARLAVLGGVDQQMALKTTISLTDAFGVSTKQLAKDINFLNAVENQTVLSIEDMTIAIPKAAPVIQQLGGNVKDLAFFLTAMKEGGINASESANALKSGLASLINPTNTASKMLQGFGINLREIVQGNKGDVKKTVVDFAQALDKLDPLNRAKAIEQLFGKFQFARMSTLFKNVIEQGSQASEVLKLASQSSLELSMLAQRELSKIEQSPLYKFQKAIADFQTQLAPVGEQFMKALTPIINFGTDVLKNFNNLGEGVKGFIVKFVAVAGVVGPVLLMSFGLIANAVANVIKGFALMKDIFNKTGKSSLSLGEQVNYMTQEQLQAAAIASSLDQVHSKLKQTFTSEAAAVDMLTAAYQRSVAAQKAFNVPVTPRGPVRKYASGGFISGPGTGTSDSIPAMLSNGEAVIPAKSVSQNKDLVQSLINNSLPRFATGGIVGTPSESLMQQVRGTSAVIAYGAHQPFTSAHQGIAQMGMSMAEQSGMPFFQFTSNQGKAKRSVLGDDLKSRMISEAIGRNPEFAKNPFELMAILSKAGIKDVNILLGEDRMKSPVWEAAAKEFGITITKTGIPRPVGSTSGTMARAAAASGNVGMFESLLASGMSKSTKTEIFKSLFAAGTSKVKRFAFGGMVRGPGGPTDDLVPANLSNGEAVIDAATTRKNPRIIGALFAGKKIVLPGYADNNSESFGFEMPSGINAGVSKTITESLRAASVAGEGVLDSLIQSLGRLGKYTQTNVDALLKTPEFQLLSSMFAAKGKSTGSQGMVKAHGTLTREVTAEEIDLFLNERQRGLVSQSTKTNAMSNLVFGMPAGFNRKQMSGAEGAGFVDNFYDDFMSVLATQGLDTNDPAAKAFGNNVARQLERAGSAVIGDSEFAEIIQNALNEEIFAVGKNVSAQTRKVFTDAKKVAAVQYNIPGIPTGRFTIASEGRGLSANGMETIPRNVKGYREVKYSDATHMRADEYSSQVIRGRFTDYGIISATAYNNSQQSILRKPENDPAMVSRDAGKRNSPHQQVSIDGKDDGVAYSQARTNAIAAEEAKASTKRNRRVSSGGIITPGESQVQQVQRTRGNRVASQGESFLPGQMIIVNPKDVVPTENTSSSPTIIPANQNFKKSVIPAPYDTSNMNFVEKQGLKLKYGQGFQGKMFGASMGLGMASMVLPGELGQIAQSGSMALGVAGMFKKAGPMLGDALWKFGKPLLRVIPYVGAAVVAFEVFDKAIVPLIRKNADAYKAITDTLSITQDKLSKINNFFGTDAKLTGIRATVAVTGDQTKEQGTIAEQFQQSQDFKDLYQESAQKMATLSDQEFRRAMEAYSVDLFGMGYEKEAVKAIIDAIAIEAKKTSVSIAPELFSLSDPKSRQLMNKNINEIISESTKQINDIESQIDSSIFAGLFEDGNARKAISGEFDNFFARPGAVDAETVEKLKANSAQIGSYISALGAQFQNGTLSAKDFTIQYDKLIAATKAMPGNSGIEMLIESIRILNPELAKALDLINAISGNSNAVGLVSEAANLGIARNIKAELALALPGDENAGIRSAVEASYQDAIDKTKANSDLVDAEEKKIKNVQKQSQGLANTEEKINDKYDKRISQLEKIKKLNDQLAKSQQGQLTLAEALNKGDIAAAAKAAVDIQNSDIQASLDNQQTGLDEARKAEVAPLKAAQEANTAAVETLTERIETLNKKTFEIELPGILNGKEFQEIKSMFGNDFWGQLGFFFTGMKGLAPGTSQVQEIQKPGKKFDLFDNGLPNGLNLNANGGFITGPGSGTSDDIPAMLSNGEYVIRANAVRKIGVNTLDKLNQADRLGFAAGGIVNAMKGKKPPRKDQEPNVDPLDPKSIAAYKKRIAKLFKPTPREEDSTWFDWTAGKQSMFNDTANYPGYYQWTAPMAVGGSFGKVKTGPSSYTWGDSPFQLYNPLNNKDTNKKLFAEGAGEAFPNPAANQNPLDIIEAYKKILEGRRRLAENVYLPDLNKDTTLMTSKNPILYTIATYAKAFMNPKNYQNSTGGEDLEKARALLALGETSKMIPGWDGLDPKEFRNLTNAMHSEFGPAATKILIGKLGFGERYDKLVNPPKGPSAKLNYAENYLGISGSIPKDSPIYRYAYNYMTNDYEGNKRGRLDWFKGSPNSFVMNPKLGTYNRLGFAKGGMVGCPCGRPGCPGCSKGYSMGGFVRGYDDGGLVQSLFGNTQGWFNNLILSMFGFGGNPSSALNATSSDIVKTGAKNTLQGYKDWVFDPSDPVDYAFAALPGVKGIKGAGKQIAKEAEKLGFPLVLQTPKKGLKITPTRLADEAEGATPGAYRTINGAEYYVKRPETPLETTGELIASTLWAKLGLGGPKLQMINKTTVASKIIPNLVPSSSGYLRQYIEKAPNKVEGANTLAKALRKYIDEGLPTNALLGNSDTHGMNILFNKDTKKFENIDLGITALTAIGENAPRDLFRQELANRTRGLVTAMKESGFNLRQTNDVLKKNGLSEVSAEDFKYSYVMGMNGDDFGKNLIHKKNLTPQINKISNMLGFDLKKSGLDPINVAAINAKSNPFIADMIKNNPELANWMNLTSKTENLESGMTGGLRELFYRLQNASKDPIQKFANGGLVGNKNGRGIHASQEDILALPADDPRAPWNHGGWRQNGNDPAQRKAYWQQWGYKPSYLKTGDPSSEEVMGAAKTMAYFTPGLGAGTLIGDSASSFGKGDIAGGIFNAAGAALGGFGPKLFEKLATFKPVQNVFNALMKPVAAVAKPIIKVATPAVEAAKRAAMRAAFGLGTVGIEQGSKSAATYVPSFMKSTMVLENNLPETNTDLRYIGYDKYLKRRPPSFNPYATNLLRERYGPDYPEVHFDSHPGLVSKRVTPVVEQKPGFLETLKGLAINKVIKPVKTVARDAATLAAAKRFGMQTKNVASLDVPWKELDPQLLKLAAKIPGMKLGKGMVLDIKAATDPYDIADMFSFDEGEVPDEMWAALKGSFRNTNAPGLKSMAGSFTGVLMKEDASTFSMKDIYIELEKEYRGKGIAQRATTQMIELLKNAGVGNVKMNAGLSDGGYAWARAGFKFNGRPSGLILRMERIQDIVNDKKFSELLDRLKTADVKDLPMPKEILGLKTPWRKYFSEEELTKHVSSVQMKWSHTGPMQTDRTNSLGELIMRGSLWEGVKELNGGSKLRKTFDDVIGSMYTKAKGIGEMGTKAISAIKTSPQKIMNSFMVAKQVKENKKIENVYNEVVKRMEFERGREFTPEELESLGILNTVKAELARKEGFEKVIQNPAIMTRRSVGSVIEMLRTNKTKTLFDTGQSRGSDDQLLRKQLENEYLGMGPDSEGLIYGYLVEKGLLRRPLVKPKNPTKVDGGTDFYSPFSLMTQHYGPVGIIMKDSSMGRATITKGDSLNSYLSLNQSGRGITTIPYKGKKTENPFDPFSASRAEVKLPEYLEAQFLKYSPRKDIESFYVENKQDRDAIRAVVKELGLKIPVRIHNKKPVVQDFFETIKNAKKQRIRQRQEQEAIDSFANGGMVRGYARGGFVLPSPEPIPTQYALGGMVRTATGGMLLNGKMYGGFANGGMVPSKFAMGGYAMGTDTVPAMLTPGEFVIKKSAVDRIGASTLAKINGYADGGVVGGMSTTSSDSVYNNNTYEINVNVSSNSNPDQIANAVMTKIRQIDNGRVRGLGR